MKLQKFFKESVLTDKPLEYNDFEKLIVQEKLTMLSSFYDELDNLFDELYDTKDFNTRDMYLTLIKHHISKAIMLIEYLNIDDILFTTNRTKINGAKLLIQKSIGYRRGKISRDSYRYFIAYMDRFYTLCYLVITENQSYEYAFGNSN